jgi:hypothetical protein
VHTQRPRMSASSWRRQELESPLRWAGAVSRYRQKGKIGKLCVPNWRGNLNSDDGNRSVDPSMDMI